MERRSVLSGTGRRKAFVRSCCAHVALAALLLASLPNAHGQAPALQPAASSSAEKAALPTLPAPDSPPATAPQATPKPETPPLPPPAEATPPSEPAAPVAPPQKPKVVTPAKPSEDLAAALERPGDLNLKGLSLEAALFTIGEQWNINIVAGDVKGTVNGTFKQAPLREILDAILLSNGYNYRQVGKSLVVSSIEQLGQINPFFQSAIIAVHSADIDEVVTGAQMLKTPKGEVRAVKSAHSIVVLDFPDRVKMIRDFVATLDGAGSGRFASAEARNGVPLEVGYFRTQHITAKSAEQALQGVLSKSGKAVSMDKEDRLLVTDFADNLEMVEKVLRSIDRPRPQVRITALIYDISLQDIERMGINWNHSFHGHPDAAGDPQSVIGIDTVTQVPVQTGTANSTVTFMNLSRHFDITAIIQCMQGASDARLLADPNVAVLDNEEALFKKVSQIPYQQLTQTQQGGQIGTTSFKEAGIVLHVTPKIAAEGLIRMTVNPEVSRLVGFTPGDNQPIIDTSSTSTVLTIGNRQTVAIGGLRQRSDVGDFGGVPYLKDLNLVGRLFRSRDLDVRESELVVFISPEIISYDNDPTCRQRIALETVRCRLDQIPEAEGCPPCCRRLPGEAGGPEGEQVLPPNSTPTPVEAPAAAAPSPPNSAAADLVLPPVIQSKSDAEAQLRQPESLSLRRMNSAEFQFGAAGQNPEVRDLVAEGRLRRLPVVEPAKTQVATAAQPAPSIFPAPAPVPTGPSREEQIRNAQRNTDFPIRR